jgi:adenylate cyclase class IV
VWRIMRELGVVEEDLVPQAYIDLLAAEVAAGDHR